MTPGSSKHAREEDSGPSRPNKAFRSGEGTREQAIVLDDSDDDGSDLTLVDLPRLGKHFKFALRLFDHEKTASKRRSERIIITTRPQEPAQDVQIKPTWIDGRLNIFFERSVPLRSGLSQYCHVSNEAETATKFSHVVSRVFDCLDAVDDFFSFEFALYKTNAEEVPQLGPLTADQKIIRGDTLLTRILEGDDEVAVRVRLREYITVASDDNKDDVFAITPGIDCTISQIRKLAAAVWTDKEAESMRLWADDLELDDDSIPLAAWGLRHMSRLRCMIETRECAICADDVGFLAWPSRTTSTCHHEVHNCTNCIRNWISSRLDNNSWDKITCLEDGCDEVYQAADVQLHAVTEELESDHMTCRNCNLHPPGHRARFAQYRPPPFQNLVQQPQMQAPVQQAPIQFAFQPMHYQVLADRQLPPAPQLPVDYQILPIDQWLAGVPVAPPIPPMIDPHQQAMLDAQQQQQQEQLQRQEQARYALMLAQMRAQQAAHMPGAQARERRAPR
ncbi:hypothetical protein FKW77_001879 [Venturia effusa]|uniref:RING-type domain-containing protein n=1 Tax=Venturia effusa TaxID=50376 RepID=A0A517LI63_9PEZI|nr:hypothetical protein FKW77_001879 [Venturia effusa]